MNCKMGVLSLKVIFKMYFFIFCCLNLFFLFLYQFSVYYFFFIFLGGITFHLLSRDNVIYKIVINNFIGTSQNFFFCGWLIDGVW